MWSHTMISVRLSHVFIDWKKYADDRRGRYAVAVSICRMQEMRTRQKFFTAWALLITAQKLALRFEQLDLLKWEQKCWNHWKLWRIFCRLQGIRELILLRKTFSQGFKGYAIQQQACREVYLRTARSLLHRSLVQWRIEWWVVYNQKKLSMEMKRNALMHWKTFVAACRQKRRWECYVQQLHRSQSRLTLDNKHRTANTFCDTRALQAQLKRYRVLMTHVLHAWYLVVQNPRKKALDFWALRLMEKSFLSWRELSSVKA
ncbi:hypothetical protein PHMEG_00013322 [Phytophthora megakarya]|uniref:Uncharacterized protein n=1 Tax=Phytophthora megakarya TaxID=4795 RepID=A0A225W701_9STRA|nr:hypothetical protein PHMEG_00013322 [Phytophthora megakarya]